jgi:NitT/TauT family transport system substrate-binding protein
MNKPLALAFGITIGLSLSTAQAADSVTIQLKWVAQAQFAGYFVAKEKGFYKDAGLDVTIKPGGPDVAPPQVIAGGGADVIVDWMPSALASREKGVPLVNISQTFKKSGLELTCRAETGIKARPSASGTAATNIPSCPGCRSSTSRPTARPAASRSSSRDSMSIRCCRSRRIASRP